MIRSLRDRFVRVALEAFLFVMLLLLIGLNAVSRADVYAGIDDRLEFLAESSLGPPDGMLASTPPEVSRWVERNNAGIMSLDSYFILSGYMTPEVRVSVLDALTGALGQDAEEVVEAALSGERSFGNVPPYRYYVAERGEAYKLVFLRCENEFAAIRSLLRSSVVVGLVCFAVALVLVLILSDKATRPFYENVQNQKRFISNASHELKTPLGVLMSDIDMQLIETGETEWLRNARLQTDTLARLIDGLTAYSLIDEKLQNAAAVPVDLSDLARAAAEDLRPLAASRGQTIEADIAPSVPVSGNEDAFRTLLTVLLDNAVKYAPDGSTLRLAVRRGRRAVIELTNPCGQLDGADASQLFERFYRAPQHRSETDGTGLGLAIAHDIVTRYGGDIRADIGDDVITFTAELPM